MATLALTVTRTDSPPMEIAVSVADSDLDRISVAYGAAYFPEGVKEEGQAPRAPTGAEILQAAIGGVLQGMMANVVQYERDQAVKAALESMQPIEITPL